MYAFVKMICDNNTGHERFDHIRALDQETGELVFQAYKNTRELISYYTNFVYIHEALLELETWCHQAKTTGEYLTRNHHMAEKLCRGFLYEFRAFVDHLETSIKRRHTENSELYRLFKEKSGYAYDNIPEYRFTYQLRNCSQHCVDIVHSIQGTPTGLRPSSVPDKLLAEFDWNAKNKAYLNNMTGNIDLQTTFEKTYNAVGYYQQPIIQYVLENNQVNVDIKYLRDWGEVLSPSSSQIFNWHFMNMKRSDGSDATPEDYNQRVSGLIFDAYPIDWKAVYEITDSLTPRKSK